MFNPSLSDVTLKTNEREKNKCILSILLQFHTPTTTVQRADIWSRSFFERHIVLKETKNEIKNAIIRKITNIKISKTIVITICC